jgi:hypothetical protein
MRANLSCGNNIHSVRLWNLPNAEEISVLATITQATDSSGDCDGWTERPRLAACAKMSPISATLKKSSCLPTAIREAAACNSSGGPLAALRSTKVIGDRV